MASDRVLRLTYDRAADAGYIYLQPAMVIQPSVATTVTADADISLGLRRRRHLVGVEVLSGRRLILELLAEAITP